MTVCLSLSCYDIYLCVGDLGGKTYSINHNRHYVTELESYIVGINDIHCHLLFEESKGQGVQRLACQTLVS